MSQDQLQALIESIKKNPQLQQQLSAAASIEDAVRLASEAGLSINADDINQAIESGSIDLTDSELEMVAGGNWGKLINSLRNDGVSCGNAAQKLLCKIDEKLQKP